MATSQHEITRQSPSRNISLKSPGTAYPRGTAMQTADNGTDMELCDGTKPYAGFLTRETVVGGPVLADHVYPGRLELPFTAGDEASLEKAEQFEAEGTDFLDAALIASNAVDTEIALIGGKAKAAAQGNYVEFIVAAVLTPQDSDNTVRLRFEKIGPYLKP
jgi:hypothetical protein